MIDRVWPTAAPVAPVAPELLFGNPYLPLLRGYQPFGGVPAPWGQLVAA